MTTRPKTSWSDLAGARVGVFGVGVEGRANLRRLSALGVRPIVVDDHPEAASPDLGPVLGSSDGGLEALASCEVVVKSPGISRYRHDVDSLQSAGVVVAGGLGLWLEEVDRSRVACITGTKGKSTTSAIAAHLLNALGHVTSVGGNIGSPPWDPDLDDDPSYWIIETSSFQATDVASSPPVVAVTSLHPDHLDWHSDTETYYRDKLSLCSQPGAELTIADGTSDALRQREQLLGPAVQWIAEPGETSWTSGLGVLGEHNRRNALIAQHVLIGLGIDVARDPVALGKAAKGFSPPSSRLQVLGQVGGVTFVDDSLSTNVLPALAALDTFSDRRVALLVGGHDRGIDYGPLAAGIARRDQETLVVTMPENGERIGAAVRHDATGVAVVDCPDLEAAVAAAYEWAEPDGVVLLSPAAPSFGRFIDYRARARAFEAAARSCGPLSPATRAD